MQPSTDPSLPLFLLNPCSEKPKQPDESSRGNLAGRPVAKVDASAEMAQIKKEMEKSNAILLALAQKVKELEADKERQQQQIFELQKSLNDKLTLISQTNMANLGTILNVVNSLPKELERIEETVDTAVQKQNETSAKVGLLIKLNLPKLNGSAAIDGLNLVLDETK